METFIALTWPDVGLDAWHQILIVAILARGVAYDTGSVDRVVTSGMIAWVVLPPPLDWTVAIVVLPFACWSLWTSWRATWRAFFHRPAPDDPVT